MILSLSLSLLSNKNFETSEMEDIQEESIGARGMRYRWIFQGTMKWIIQKKLNSNGCYGNCLITSSLPRFCFSRPIKLYPEL